MRSMVFVLILFNFPLNIVAKRLSINLQDIPIVCTNDSPTQYFNFPKLPSCNYNYKNKTKIRKYEVFKPNTIEYISNAYLCKKVVSEVSMYTDLSGYEHLVEKEINNKEVTVKECEEMIKNKYCEFGILKKGDHSYHTNNKIANEYPNRFISFVKPKQYLKENCILIVTKLFAHYDQKSGFAFFLIFESRS